MQFISPEPGEYETLPPLGPGLGDCAAGPKTRCQNRPGEDNPIQFSSFGRLLHPLIVAMQGGVFVRVWNCIDLQTDGTRLQNKPSHPSLP